MLASSLRADPNEVPQSMICFLHIFFGQESVVRLNIETIHRDNQFLYIQSNLHKRAIFWKVKTVFYIQAAVLSRASQKICHVERDS